MRNTWRTYLRRLAATTAFSGSIAWSSAMCYAVQVLYSDNAGNAAYSDGWQEGDDGDGPGGFGPWNFDGVSQYASGFAGYGTVTALKMDDGLKTGAQTSSPHNDIGKSWMLHNPNGRNVGAANGGVGTDISQPGRTFPALQVGQTLSVLLDNPIQRNFYRGFTLILNSGPDASGCYAGDNCSTPAYDPGSVTAAWSVGTFEYFDYGVWDGTELFDVDTDSGVWIDVTLTSATEYSFTMTPLDTNIAPYTETGTVTGSGAIDWVELQFYNTDSDFYPTMIPNPQATDFYVREMKITIPDAAGEPGDYNNNGVVDTADYVIWRKTNGTGYDLQNEVTGASPSQVDQLDYNEWKKRYGEPSAGSGGGGGVPEPGTFVCLALGAGLMFAGGRRSRGR